MRNNRALWAMVISAVGILQAWDSGVGGAGTAVQVLVGAAIAAPALALLLGDRYGVRAGSVVVMLILLTWARVMAPMSLNALHVMLVPAWFIVFFLALSPRSSRSTADRPGTCGSPTRQSAG